MPEKPPALRRRPTATGSWVRSLHCKSTAAEDVAATVAALPKKSHLLLRSNCGSSGDIHRNVTSCKPKPKSSPRPSPETKKPKAKTTAVPPPPPAPGPLGPLPALTELPAGHSSRQVVEIIFLSSWSPLQPAPPSTSSGGGAFAGEVEMLFRVHNQARAVACFEDYRAAVRARAGAGAGAARSAADGNEMMRFSPAPPYGCSSSDSASGEDALRVVRTFDGSGGAHAATGGRGPESGRRAMFLCRVIAGRVAEGAGSPEPRREYDSVRTGKGELVVFDRRAVLPCFLIIYKL